MEQTAVCQNRRYVPFEQWNTQRNWTRARAHRKQFQRYGNDAAKRSEDNGFGCDKLRGGCSGSPSKRVSLNACNMHTKTLGSWWRRSNVFHFHNSEMELSCVCYRVCVCHVSENYYGVCRRKSEEQLSRCMEHMREHVAHTFIILQLKTVKRGGAGWRAYCILLKTNFRHFHVSSCSSFLHVSCTLHASDDFMEFARTARRNHQTANKIFN